MSRPHEKGFAGPGSRYVFAADDQETYNGAKIGETGRTHGINMAGYHDKTGIMDKVHEQEASARKEDRLKHEPGFAAISHGNRPSRGAQIDAELARDDAEMVAKKNQKSHTTDSLPGKKMEAGSSKSERKREIEGENMAARAEHSNSGSNTGENQGMGYETRKTRSSRNE